MHFRHLDYIITQNSKKVNKNCAFLQAPPEINKFTNCVSYLYYMQKVTKQLQKTGTGPLQARFLVLTQVIWAQCIEQFGGKIDNWGIGADHRSVLPYPAQLITWFRISKLDVVDDR